MAEFVAEVEYDGCRHQVVKWRGEIVRCHDCAHYQQMQEGCMFCYYHGLELPDINGYCSWGEQR